MRVQGWLGRIFDPPVTQRHFDRAMAEQTEAIRKVGDKVDKGNDRIVAALADVVAEIRSLRESGSEVSDSASSDDEADG